MNDLEKLAVKFLQEEEYKIKVRKAGVFRFVEEYRFLQHSHIEYEINFISSGQAVMEIEGKKIVIPKGQCIVIPPYKKHSFRVESKAGCRLTQLEMSLQMGEKEKGFLAKEGEDCDCFIIRECEDLIPLIERIARLYRQEEDEYHTFLLKLTAVDMMITLNHYICQKDKQYSAKMKSRLQLAMDYIQEHYFENIDLEQVAEQAGISSRYLRKYFSEVVGMSCIHYITKLRMEKAKHLLWETNKNIITIAVESGYDNAQYFSRVFKKAEGVTPKEYRMRWREEKR